MGGAAAEAVTVPAGLGFEGAGGGGALEAGLGEAGAEAGVGGGGVVGAVVNGDVLGAAGALASDWAERAWGS